MKKVLFFIFVGCILGQALANEAKAGVLDSVRNIMRVGRNSFYGDGSCPPHLIHQENGLCNRANEICLSQNKYSVNLYYDCEL